MEMKGGHIMGSDYKVRREGGPGECGFVPPLKINLCLWSCCLACGPCLLLSCLLQGMTFMVNGDAVSKSSY